MPQFVYIVPCSWAQDLLQVLGGIVKQTAMNICVRVFLGISVLISHG